MPQEEYIIHTLVSCDKPQGPGGYATIVITPKEKQIIMAGRATQTTVTRMEITAIIDALDILPPRAKGHIFTYTEQTRDNINYDHPQHWLSKDWTLHNGQPVPDQDLWKLYAKAKEDRDILCSHWTEDHTNNEQHQLVLQCHLIAEEQANLAQQYLDTQNILTSLEEPSEPNQTPEQPTPFEFREEPEESNRPSSATDQEQIYADFTQNKLITTLAQYYEKRAGYVHNEANTRGRNRSTHPAHQLPRRKKSRCTWSNWRKPTRSMTEETPPG